MEKGQRASTVLIIDDDHDIAEIVRSLLVDEGFHVSVLHGGSSELVRLAVDQLEPDCVLLDGESASGYGRSWAEAAWMTQRARPIPVIMFTARHDSILEAQAGTSDRAISAGFAGIITKPFDIDEMFNTVSRCVGRSAPR